jgi:hypothetical protein
MPPITLHYIPACRSYAKGFAYFGALYSFNECVIEKARAKHDKVNPALAGCATGAMMAYSGEWGGGGRGRSRFQRMLSKSKSAGKDAGPCWSHDGVQWWVYGNIVSSRNSLMIVHM